MDNTAQSDKNRNSASSLRSGGDKPSRFPVAPPVLTVKTQQQVSAGHAEQEKINISPAEKPTLVESDEFEIPPEVEHAGVTSDRSQVIDLPPDVQKLGVSLSGASLPVTSAPVPKVILPISDSKVLRGLHAHITSAVKWLAFWCIRKLAKAHLRLKVIHGKVIRVRTG